MSSFLKIYLTLFWILISFNAFAFPEMVRHGYGNCITCHYSPNGGGLLTAYGRGLISQVLSTGGTPEEGQFLYGAVKLPEAMAAGGDFRFLQHFMNSASAKSAKIIPMQMDFEAAITIDKFTAVATAGADHELNPLSRRHYVIYQPHEEISFRAGRFMPAYGINTENHSLAIKRGLGKDQSGETYNMEAAYVGENFNAYLTGIFGRPEAPNLGAETGAAVSGSWLLSDRYKVGMSYYYGDRNIAQRHVFGPFFILGFSKTIFLLAEADLQVLRPKDGGGTQTGFLDDVRLDFEVLQGLHVYLIQEWSKFPTSAVNASTAYGFGIQFFPRPHYEVNGTYQKVSVGSGASGMIDMFWLLLHFYL